MRRTHILARSGDGRRMLMMRRPFRLSTMTGMNNSRRWQRHFCGSTASSSTGRSLRYLATNDLETQHERIVSFGATRSGANRRPRRRSDPSIRALQRRLSMLVNRGEPAWRAPQPGHLLLEFREICCTFQNDLVLGGIARKCAGVSRVRFMAAGLWASYDEENQNEVYSEAHRFS